MLAHYLEAADATEWGTIEVFDSQGGDASPVAPQALDMLRRSIAASEAVLDGIITSQRTTTGEGVSPTLMGPAPLRQLLGRFRPDAGATRPADKRPGNEPSAPRDPAFVALDLLSIDRQPLFDVPLLERKRLLDSLVRETELVRLSPWVRPPMRSWLTAWRAAGFRGLVAKGANSRYVPGEESVEWAIVKNMP